MRSDIIKRSPVAKKGVGGPTTGSLDYVRGYTCEEEFSRPSDPKAMSSGTRVAEGAPDFITTTKKKRFGKRENTVRSNIRKKMSVVGDVVDLEMFQK